MSWEMVAIKSVGKVYTGKTPSKLVSEYFGGDIPFITPTELDKDVYVNSSVQTITKSGAKQVTVIPENSIMVCCIGSLGKIGIAQRELATNQQINSIVFDENKVFPKYGYYACSRLKPILESLAPATTVAIVNKSKFEALQIPLPPLPEQKRIAAILDKADSLRRKRQQAMQLADEFLRAVFLDMFGDPVTNPKGWEVKNLNDLSVKIHSGNTPTGGSKVYVKNGVVFFRSQNVWKKNLMLDDVVYIDELTHKKMIKSSLKHKDILMTKTGRVNTENSSLGRAAIFLGEDDSANINGHVYLIRLKNTAIHEFVLHILTTNEYREHIRQVCVGGIDKRQLNKDHLEQFPIIYPPIELQQKFTKCMQGIERQKKLTMQSLKESEKLFNSLSQKAFAGEL